MSAAKGGPLSKEKGKGDRPASTTPERKGVTIKTDNDTKKRPGKPKKKPAHADVVSEPSLKKC